eukprot:TRINITY_DN8254_c0_g1_i15.p1 TRINITY_DN8254_c0_g1~~TRINITY_DN8254_c0_g1_i15.p1  ORF type:complete len:120 (-),score=10.92 TRINITY_DN8254_c0_g1_i15:8-367(-)
MFASLETVICDMRPKSSPLDPPMLENTYPKEKSSPSADGPKGGVAQPTQELARIPTRESKEEAKLLSSATETGMQTPIVQEGPGLLRPSSTQYGTDRKSGSAGMPRPISYAVFCLKKKN